MTQTELSEMVLVGLADADAANADESPAPAGGQSQGAGRRPSRGRQDWFRVLALIAVAIFLVRSTNLLAPWVFVLSPNEPHAEPHRWFYTLAAAGDLFFVVGLAVLMNRLRRPPMTVIVALWLLLALTTIVPFEPGFLVLLIFVVPPYVIYPYWRDLRGFRAWWSGAHLWLVGFAMVVGAGLLAASVIAMRRQIENDGAVADAHLWNDYAMHAALIAVVCVLAAGTAAGARLLRGWLGLVGIYLGAVATWALPDATGSWGVAGGVTAMVVGAVFLVSTWWDRRRERRRAEEQPAEQVMLPAQRHAPETRPALPEQRPHGREHVADREEVAPAAALSHVD